MVDNLVDITLDRVSFKLKEYHDFSWVKRYGEVFCVFDKQDSGNICFGVEKDNKRYFIKYAGAKTTEFNGSTKVAVKELEDISHIYKDLNCNQLISLIDSFKTKFGYAAVFEWVEGRNLHEHWTFDDYPKYTHPESAYYRYKNLSLEKRLKSIDIIFQFLCNVEKKGYVAIDFYDGSIMYDFNSNSTKICDVDFFRKKPTINNIGKDFWGSDRFKSPEEYTLNASIDEKTNVFNLGTLIFGLLGSDKDHSLECWQASQDLYDLVIIATKEDRDKRFKSVSDFYKMWSNSL